MNTVDSFSQGIPPRIEEVQVYFQQKGIPLSEADHFFLFHDSKKWLGKNGRFITSWKSSAFHWINSVLADQPWLRRRRKDP
jgi:hypothetical protein